MYLRLQLLYRHPSSFYGSLRCNLGIESNPLLDSYIFCIYAGRKTVHSPTDSLTALLLSVSSLSVSVLYVLAHSSSNCKKYFKISMDRLKASKHESNSYRHFGSLLYKVIYLIKKIFKILEIRTYLRELSYTIR